VPQTAGLVRGRVYYADLGHGEKPWLVVSNDRRNTQLDSALAVRITTSVKPQLASIIELDTSDPLVGRVLCDDVNVIYTDEVKRDAGALSQRTMMRVADGLRSVFAL
jgi:mRNA interferase MazF